MTSDELLECLSRALTKNPDAFIVLERDLNMKRERQFRLSIHEMDDDAVEFKVTELMEDSLRGVLEAFADLFK